MTLSLPAIGDITEALLDRLRDKLAESRYDAMVRCGFEDIQYLDFRTFWAR